MNKADAAIDRASERLSDLSDSLEERGGLAAKAAEPVAEDAAFLPKLKPSLIEERLKENPTGSEPADEPSTPAKRKRPTKRSQKAGGHEKTGAKKVLPLVAGAFGAGVVLAKIIDWRGHAHPRD